MCTQVRSDMSEDRHKTVVAVQEERKEERKEDEEQRIVSGYAGSVRPVKRNKRKQVTSFQVRFGKRKKARPESRYFSILNFGGSEEKAKEAAEEYRRQRSNALGLTIYHHQCFTRVFEPLAKQFVAGCYDGDGCIRGTSNALGIRVAFAQSGPSMHVSPQIIQFLHETYGGKAYLNSTERKLMRRPGWELVLDNRAAQTLLEHISDHGVVKQPQAGLVLPTVRKMIPLRLTPKDEAVKPELIATLKLMKTQYATVLIPPSRLTTAYIAGLFESEGCVMLHKLGLRAQISQSQCVALLHAIRDVMQAGHVDDQRIALYGSFALTFLRSIAPFLVGKRAQVELVLANEHLLFCGGLTDEQAKKRETLRKTLSDMKHAGAWSIENELEFLQEESE